MVNIQDYRQPMVTATGIFLGFMLNFTSDWVKDAFTVQKFRDIVIAISVGACLSLLILVLFRILRPKYPTEPDKFYRKTLLFFLIGISIPFLAFLIIIIDKMAKNLF